MCKIWPTEHTLEPSESCEGFWEVNQRYDRAVKNDHEPGEESNIRIIHFRNCLAVLSSVKSCESEFRWYLHHLMFYKFLTGWKMFDF